MSGDDLFTVVSEAYRNERRSKVLTKLPTNFYKISEEYLASQKEEYAQAILIPGNPKTMMLQDQIKKVEKRLKSIYEIRERKITIAALDNMGGARSPENMTKKDKELFDHIVTLLKSFRSGIEPPEMPEVRRPVVSVTTPKPEPRPVQESLVPEAAVVDAAAEEPAGDIDEGLIVHVLEDIPSFVGMEHTYDLRKDDMVTLPSQFANILLSKGKVRIVEG